MKCHKCLSDFKWNDARVVCDGLYEMIVHQLCTNFGKNECCGSTTVLTSLYTKLEKKINSLMCTVSKQASLLSEQNK